MKNWYTENSKWLIPTITFLGGVLFGLYVSVLRYESKIETVNIEIRNLSDDIHELKDIIQNRVLTKTGE